MGRYAVASEHFAFYCHNGYVEFENILDPEDAVLLQQAAERLLALRLNCDTRELSIQATDKIFQQGRDLWRSSDAVRRIVCSSRLAEVAAQLTRLPLLRIGFDQLILQGRFFKAATVSLEEMSSIQGLVCGALIRLTEGDVNNSPLSAIKVGNAVYFSSLYPMDLGTLLTDNHSSYLLITYADKKAFIQKNQRDWAGPSWMDLGYAQGDRLSDVLHPYIWRPSR